MALALLAAMNGVLYLTTAGLLAYGRIVAGTAWDALGYVGQGAACLGLAVRGNDDVATYLFALGLALVAPLAGSLVTLRSLGHPIRPSGDREAWRRLLTTGWPSVGTVVSESATFRMNVALSELPRFSALPRPGDHLTAGIIMAPSLAYMDRAYLTARTEGWSREPIVEMLIPSTLDDSLAPAGSHVASLFCQHFPYEVEGGWDSRRDEAADHIIAHVDRFAPGFAAAVIEPCTATSRNAVMPAMSIRHIYHAKHSLAAYRRRA